MKKFFVLAATCLLALACNNAAVKVSDPESDLNKIVEATAGDSAKATAQAGEYITAYAKALSEKLITQEQFDAFIAGLTEKAGVPAETVDSFVETAKAQFGIVTEEADDAEEAAETKLDESIDAAKNALDEQVDAANEAITKAAEETGKAIEDAANEIANAFGSALGL